MVQPPLLSVVLPNYNHGHLLPRAIAAMVAQERPPDEIFIVDDGSTDNSRAVIEQLASRHPTIRPLFNNKNQGVVPTSNRGRDVASGRYIYLAASDDWVLPGFFKLALDALEAHPTAGLFCAESVLIDGASHRPIAVRPPVRPAHRPAFISAAEATELLKRSDNWILTNSCVFRNECMTEAGGQEPGLGPFADGILARKIALTHGFLFAPQVVACWAVFTDGYSRRSALNIDRARHYLELVPARIAQDPTFPKWYPALFADRWRFGTSRLALETEPIDYALITAMAARSSLDRVALKTIWALPGRWLTRVATLAWLWLRLRPTSLAGLTRTALAGRMKPFRDCTQITVPSPPDEVSGARSL
jgi:glycosyltransferase involved in cell wall biosynthesis